MGEVFGAEVYIFLLILGAPIFFFWRWVFRKHIASTRKRRIIIWITTIITAPLIYIIFALMFFGISEYYPNRDFDKKAWLTDTDRRYEFTHDIIKSKMLIGKTKDEVLQLLGNDADTSMVNELGYTIGYRPEIADIDPSYLTIEFINGKADTVIEHDR